MQESQIDTETGKHSYSLGFLTVVDHQQHGLFGGYLVLNTTGRPMEFHCTAPIKPNHAQQILYGPTLEPFIYGEQIGQTLLEKAGAQPMFVCIDHPALLAVREHVSTPVALVLPVDDHQTTENTYRLDDGTPMVHFQHGSNRLAVSERADDHRLITEHLAELAESFDLVEPFARIREAIDEAQRAVGSGEWGVGSG